MKGWIPTDVVMQALKSPGLKAYLRHTYRKAIPCTVQLALMDAERGRIGVDFAHPGWSPCSAFVPLDAVDIECSMKSTSLPLRHFLGLRQWVKLGNTIGG